MQNVFIINFNSLYEILDEIKENLSFKVINFDNEEDFKKNNDLDTLNCLIISKTNSKLLLNKNITAKNFFDLHDLPLPLKKLLELILLFSSYLIVSQKNNAYVISILFKAI